jgi:hypothetical protein
MTGAEGGGVRYETFIEAGGLFASEIYFLSRALGPWGSYRGQVEPTCCIHVEVSENGLAGVATDRRRMHVVDPLHVNVFGGADFGPGAWRALGGEGEFAWIAKVADENTELFVPWKKIIPEGTPEYTREFAGYSPEWEEEGDTVGAEELTRLIREFPEETAIQLRYLADLGRMDRWTVEWRRNNRAVVFESGNRKAVIMPLEPAGGTGKREGPWTGKR